MQPGFFSLEGQRNLLDDVSILLHHLSALPESRLDAAFAGVARNGSGIPFARPPADTTTKDDFLEEVMRLEERLAPGTAVVEAGSPAASRAGPLGPEDLAFLIASRDFLATLARPATVESIRITREYVRTIPLGTMADLLRRGWARLFGGKVAEDAVSLDVRRSARFGRRLAVFVRLWQLGTLVLVLVTLALSIYVLTGRGLVREVGAIDAMVAALGADMDAAEQNDAPVFALIAGGGSDRPGDVPKPQVQRYCDQVRREGGTNGDVVYFATRRQQRLCDRYDGYNKNLVLLFDRLKVWHSHVFGRFFPVATTCPYGQILAFTGSEERCVRPAANGGELTLVQYLRPEVLKAQVVLQAITEYLLPCLYAMLGALAAAIGNMARKAEDATLSFSDGGAIFRTLVLGVLFGAVIGLFSSQVGVTGGAAGSVGGSLTPAALSLLAGYSVAQVFQFFDGLSIRVFGPRSPAGTPTG